MAAGVWQQASSAHFVVYSDDSAARVATFTARLERFDKAMRVMRGVADATVSPSNRVTVFVLRDTDAVRRIYGARASTVAGFYIPRASGSVAFVPRDGDGTDSEDLGALPILLHEYAHHWMFETWGSVAIPGWFVEGFAEFNATMRFKPDGSVIVGAPPLYRAYGMLDRQLVPIRTLLTANPQSLPADAIQTFYSRAWLLVHYLTFDPERRKRLGDYLAAINAGKPAVEAMAMLGDLRTFDDRLDAYARKPMILSLTLAGARLTTAPVAIRPLTAAEVAMMPALVASRRGVGAKDAGTVAALARRLAAAFPIDAAAQNELAEAEYDAGDFAAAQAAAARALAAEPASVHAMVYAGLSRMAIARKAKEADRTEWKAIRGWFVRANRAENEDPWPLQLYYESYGAAGESPSTNAEDGLIRAHELAPFDQGLSLEVASVYLRRGDADWVRATLKPVAFDPHGADTAKLATRLLGALDGPDGIAAARALMRGDGKAKNGANDADIGLVRPRVLPGQ